MDYLTDHMAENGATVRRDFASDRAGAEQHAKALSKLHGCAFVIRHSEGVEHGQAAYYHGEFARTDGEYEAAQ
jgi:hypothetical protein